MAASSRKALMKKLATAKASGVGNNIRDGKYRWAIKKMSLEDGFKGSRFQVVFTVMSSAKIHVVSPLTNAVLDIAPDPVGRDVDWLQMLDDAESVGPSKVRQLFLDLFNKKEMTDDEYIETLAEMADLDVDGEPLKTPLNLARGMVIEGETIRNVTAKKKKEIVVVKWSHVEQSSEEQVEVCKWLDSVAMHAAAQAQLPQGAAA